MVLVSDELGVPPVQVTEDAFSMLGRVKQLDGVRGIAILLVLLFHATVFNLPIVPHNQVDYTWRVLAGWGWSGVDLFFALSGFLITGILLKTKSSPGYYKQFIVRRALRIFPLYFLYLFAAFVVIPKFCQIPDFQTFRHYQAYFFSYMANVAMWQFDLPISFFFSQLWSVCVEEQFYILWPFVVMLVPNRWLPRLAMSMIVASIGFKYFALPGDVSRLMPACWDGLGCGVVLATLPRTAALFKRSSGFALAGAGVLGVAYLTLVNYKYVPDHIAPGVPLTFLYHVPVCMLATALLILALEKHPLTWLDRMLTSKLLATMGKYSYAMYLFHFPILFFDIKYTLPLIAPHVSSTCAMWAITFVLNTTESFALAFISFHLFEKHFLRLKDKFAPHGEVAPPAAVSEKIPQLASAKRGDGQESETLESMAGNRR